MQQSAARTLVTVLSVSLAVLAVAQQPQPDAEATVDRATLPLVLYDNARIDDELPFIPSGWMGNTEAIEFDDSFADAPHSGETCIRVRYNDSGKWAGVVWQSPADDWGDEPGGHDLTGARKLTFWARGDQGGEVVEFKIGIIPKSKPYGDSASATAGKVKLSQEWHQYEINLSGKDLSQIKSGFVFAVQGRKDPVTFYLDDIRYE
jgi:hypothetical protein